MCTCIPLFIEQSILNMATYFITLLKPNISFRPLATLNTNEYILESSI